MKVTLAIVKGTRQALYLDDELFLEGSKLSGKKVVDVLVQEGVLDATIIDCCPDDLTERRFPDSLLSIEVSDEPQTDESENM
jgi:hypothetical protein